jgi:hypothetical protein
LELYKSDRERAEIALNADHPKLGTSKAPERQFDWDGYDQGCRDGEAAQLNRSIE